MSAGAARYAKDDCEADPPIKVCAEAGRKCVRNIHLYPILSVEWLSLTDSLKQLTRLVHMEGRMPSNNKVSETQGRNAESSGTLWDQEAHENAIRILVEEAKVNLCLRMINEFKKWQLNPAERKATMAQAVKAYDRNELQLQQKCHQFEESLSLLLMRAFLHVETLQLMDIPLLIEHVVMILENSHKLPAVGVNAKTQETYVLHYFSSMMKHSEALNNSELLAKSREQRMLTLAVSHFLQHSDGLPPDVTVAFAEGLAAMADNEDFKTEWERFFETEDGASDMEARRRFMELDEKLLQAVLKDAPEKKAELRPLIDFFKRVQKTIR